MTEWYTYPSFGNGQFEVSNDGQVRSVTHVANGCVYQGNRRKQMLTSGRVKYRCVQLSQGWHNRVTKYVHTMVCETFYGPRPSGMEVRHLDGDSLNNHVDNLCWGTPAQNGFDRIRHGMSERNKPHGHVKLAADQVRAIREDDRAQTVVAADYGVSQSAISAIHTGESWGWYDVTWN